MHSLAVLLGRRALVLRQFNINPTGPELVHVVARKAGLVSWLLTIMGIDTTTVFRVFGDRIEFQQGTLSGEIQTVIPLRSVSIASCGYTKPILFLVLAVVCLVSIVFFTFLGVGATGVFVPLILSAIAFVFYFLNKTLLISVVSNSSWPAEICFKRSVIEGVNVDYEQAKHVIQMINDRLMQQTSK